MTIGERIKMLREQHDISQIDLAKKLKTTKQTIYKYENNIVTNIPLNRIERIADIFNVHPAYIMGWIDEENPETEDTQPDPDLVVLDAYRLLDTEDKAEIRGEMKHMLKADKYNNTSISGEIAEVLKNIRVSPINIE